MPYIYVDLDHLDLSDQKYYKKYWKFQTKLLKEFYTRINSKKSRLRKCSSIMQIINVKKK